MTALPELPPPKIPATRYNRTGPAATALRLAGASYAEVAETLGLASPVDARNLVEKDLGRFVTDEGRDFLRAEEAARIESLLRTVWEKASDPDHFEHLPAVRVALALIDRHARLLGLDMPTEMVVYAPSAAEIDQWVNKVLGLQHADVDVVEGEVVGQGW